MIRYRMPAEFEKHEGTWLTWPHLTFWGEQYHKEIEPIWRAMVKALHTGETVHLIVEDEEVKAYASKVLAEDGVDISLIDFNVIPTDDIWLRDCGPLFVRDENGDLSVINWIYNGYGNRAPCEKDNLIPVRVAENLGLPRIDIPVCVEGGNIHSNGRGSFLGSMSCVFNPNRNPDLTKEEFENILNEYLGITNPTWISGMLQPGRMEATDFHIDGQACFADEKTILYNFDPWREGDEEYVAMYDKHYTQLHSAKREDGGDFKYVPIPMSRQYFEAAGRKGSYTNFYIGNDVVLVPIYNDVNDELALKIIEGQFPGRKVIGIDIRPLYPYGGMIHCVTQQQPMAKKD